MKIEKEVHFDNVIVGGNRGDNIYNAYISCHIFLKGEEQDMLKNKKYKGKLTLEVEEPILDEAEIKYLSGVIRPFRNKVKYIQKDNDTNGEYYIFIYLKNHEYFSLPNFKKDTMYKNMKLKKEYTLEELGL